MPETLDRELEMRIDLLQDGTYRLELAFDDPNDAAETSTEARELSLDFRKLRSLEFEDAEYGQALSNFLFAHAAIKQYFIKAKTVSAGAPLHLRLSVDAAAKDLNGIRWELLLDPEDKTLLSTSERILFSRFVASSSWNPVKLRAKSQLRALIAVSAPTDLAERKLAPVNKAAEIALAEKALAGIDLTYAGRDEALTINTLIDRIRGVDIVYLVCHGSFDGGPVLILQRENGSLVPVNGKELVTAIAQMPQAPRLMVLASCQSAGESGPFLVDALGPQLAMAGVPAVIAMQANVQMRTVEVMMPRFFTELLRDGQVDRAMAVARAAARRDGALDVWVPALLLRLKGGRIWYQPGFGDTGSEDEDVSWDSICRAVVNKELVPVLGPDLAEHIFGTSTEFARDLAAAKGIAVRPDEQPDRTKIAQTIETKHGRTDLKGSTTDLAVSKLEGAAKLLPPDPEKSDLERVVTAGMADPDNPFRILSELDVKVYVTGAMDSVLCESLKKAGKQPLEIFCDWRNEATSIRTRLTAAADQMLKTIEENPQADPEELVRNWRDQLLVPEDSGSLPDGLEAAADSLKERITARGSQPAVDVIRKWRNLTCNPPTETLSKPWPVQEPLIYYVYGKYRYPGTWVLTQDDYFDYLIRHASYQLMPVMVADKLVSGSLLFLGFPLEDWTFRILFRMILSKDGKQLLRRNEYKHVGVQVDPEYYTPSEAARLKPLLVKYFGTAANINIYWGSSSDFLTELRDRMRTAKPVVAQKKRAL